MTIENKDDWWNAVHKHWDNLLSIIFHHMDGSSPAYSVPGNSDSKMTGRNIYDELIYLKKSGDHERLARYFNAAWGLASEAYAWSVPSWGVLCDLCSEEWVFQEQL